MDSQREIIKSECVDLVLGTSSYATSWMRFVLSIYLSIDRSIDLSISVHMLYTYII